MAIAIPGEMVIGHTRPMVIDGCQAIGNKEHMDGIGPRDTGKANQIIRSQFQRNPGIWSPFHALLRFCLVHFVVSN
jgi:hypothetical protein